MSKPVRLAVWSKGLLRNPYLGALLDAEIAYRPGRKAVVDVSGIVCWGRKDTSERARRVGSQRGLPIIQLEDGFLRSFGLGSDDPPLSIVVDDLGVYYDATVPSRLESLVAAPLTDLEELRAQELMVRWRSARVSKYNHAPEPARFPAAVVMQLARGYVLAVDQTSGDASIRYGLGDVSSFQRMLSAALAENPACIVLLKVHPEVVAGRKRGHFDLAAVARNSRVRVLGVDVHPVSLLEHARAVYVVTSQMGFEGLLWGKPVRTFGMPFYAGWGLTDDELPGPSRRGSATLEQLVHAALVAYPRYVNPETGQRCEVEEVLRHLALQRKMRDRFPSQVYAVGFSRWKKPIVRSFFWGSQVLFARRAARIPTGACVVVWGRKPPPWELPPDVSLVRLEDGFLRSVGLGADLVRPLSWVIDRQGIYYDATQVSDLEAHLQNICPDGPLLTRAAVLRARIVASGLTKYNVGGVAWTRPQQAVRVVLVPGQGESDASIQYGAPVVRTNMGLLQAVREANPDAWVVYKPHPDVLAGLRKSGTGEEDALHWCDELLGDAPMGQLLAAVDEVHVLTSLAGFEALLRGKKVVCYGQPFYAGWGLTDDRVPVLRRTRRLTLDQLVAGTLILYPTYVSRSTGRFTTPERALDELLEWRDTGPDTISWVRRLKRFILRQIVGVR